MDTQLLWQKIDAAKDYHEWRKQNDAFEQIGIIKSWSDYEDYNVSDLCHNDIREVVCLYCYLHFVLGVEFLDAAQEIANDIYYEDNLKVDVDNAKLLERELYKKR